MKSLIKTILSCFLALSSVAHGAMEIDNYTSATNDRFQDADDPDEFFLRDFDLSGVGQDSNGRWATLIGSNTIISANHYKPSGTISFFANNSPSSTLVQMTLSGDAQRIGNSDLWVARLNEFAPSNFAIYGIATETISEPASPVQRANFSYRDQQAFMVGRSPANFPNNQDQAYGTNLIYDYFVGNVSGLGDVEALQLNYDTNPSETDYESYFQVFDSGAPLLFDNGNNELLLLGINSFINEDPKISFSSYVGNDSTEINNLIAQYEAIPEPSVTVLTALFFIGLLSRRSRIMARA